MGPVLAREAPTCWALCRTHLVFEPFPGLKEKVLLTATQTRTCRRQAMISCLKLLVDINSEYRYLIRRTCRMVRALTSPELTGTRQLVFDTGLHPWSFHSALIASTPDFMNFREALILLSPSTLRELIRYVSKGGQIRLRVGIGIRLLPRGLLVSSKNSSNPNLHHYPPSARSPFSSSTVRSTTY